ncbi:MAG: HAMP domain-containing protein [Ignavibacteriae bacterium]|nr:HAMP domain-containing protein [Ignavibacteriota bacterium]
MFEMTNVAFLKFRRLGSKVALIVALVSVIFGGAFIFVAYKTGSQMLEEVGHAKAYAVAGLGKALLEHLMVAEKRNKIPNVLKSAMSFSQVSDAFVLKPDGTVAWGASARGNSPNVRIDQFVDRTDEFGNRYFSVKEDYKVFTYVLSPISNKRECNRCHGASNQFLGYFTTKISTDDLQAIATEHRTTNMLMAGLTFGGVSLSIFLVLTLLVVRPIRSLHSHISEAERGLDNLESGKSITLTSLPEPRGTDEVADLQRTFNNLVARLNVANAQLHVYHQEQLEHADRVASAGEMAASLAHEIKNPVAGVLGALQVLDSEIMLDDQQKELLAEMMAQMERINNAVNDLLSYARPSPPLLTRLDVNEVVRKTILLLSQQIKEKEIQLTLNLTSESATITADKKLLQQLLWNIALNGVQAMKGSGTLLLHTRKQGSSVRIDIQDTGAGIPPENLERIFTPFFTTKHKGTGLGLAICRRIVEQHQGTMSIASEPGRGTTVTVIMPTNNISLPKGMDTH